MSSRKAKNSKPKDKVGVVSIIKENQILVFSLIFVAIFIDVFFIKTSSDYVSFGMLILYGVFAKVLCLKSNVTFLLCLGLLLAMFVSFLIAGTSVSAEKAAVWLFLFMALGIFQQWKE